MLIQPHTSGQPATIASPDEALWYRDAVIYQLHVRSFHDSNGDGIGDFVGLTQKLDYIQELGVTALWVMPFYPSPLKDDGYDIADYTSVNPMYGTLDDFGRFLEAAHRRGLKVITELVMNHTSDQHPWFQRARRAKPGDPHRDYYVWSDTADRYRNVRIIFQDFETSNWTWDHQAEAYYWHRFYSHQPDLNFENPAVREAMFGVLDFWLGMGVDAFRLDAVPYLFEEEGTSCENLPDTHACLKSLRRHIDENYPNRMLLAEANQWPEDAADYFGDGDECHMNFHFPLMPRLFMALQREDRFPVIDILDQTPAIPDNCQWAIFLRNHDELTLEMVTDEERDYMYRTYAEDPQSRINLGIRRRLAPLLKNSRRKIELMNGLLFSLPGTPIVYYGDEIRMGDNIYLGDRDGVRTPMQWSPDRNAGFSRANPQQLFLPPVIDSEYHFATRNVETEQNSPHSLLWWMRGLIRLRRQHRVFGRGSIEFLRPDNHRVLVFLREYEDEQVLVVANLSRYTQCVELDLSRHRGRTPVEMFGQTPFPMIGELPYFLTLGPHSFYWFRLEWPAGEDVRYSPEELPAITVHGQWDSLFTGAARRQVEELLPEWLRKHRWFGGKARTIQRVELRDRIQLEIDRAAEASPASSPEGESAVSEPVCLAVVQVTYTEGEADSYLLPWILASHARASNILADRPAAGVLRVTRQDTGEQAWLCDATAEPEFWQPLMTGLGSARKWEQEGVTLRSFLTETGRRALAKVDRWPDPAVYGGQQSNTSAVFDSHAILKLFRRTGRGINPDLEIGRYLTEASPFPHVPAVLGGLELVDNQRQVATVALLQEYVANEGDAWQLALDELNRYLEVVTSEYGEIDPGPETLPHASPLELAHADVPEAAQQVIGPILTMAALLGQRTAELHNALAAPTETASAEFAPLPFTVHYQRSLYQSMRTQVHQTLRTLRSRWATIDESLQPGVARILEREDAIVAWFQKLTAGPISASRIRCHGDYHLGQVLYTGRDFLIIDFEGEPDRPVSERRIRRSPLRDVAGMLRSFHYATSTALLTQLPATVTGQAACEGARRWLEVWYLWNSAAFLRGWLTHLDVPGLIPEDPEALRALLDAFVAEKLLYELRYELNNRPDWIQVPLYGLLQVTDTLNPSATPAGGDDLCPADLDGSTSEASDEPPDAPEQTADS